MQLIKRMFKITSTIVGVLVMLMIFQTTTVAQENQSTVPKLKVKKLEITNATENEVKGAFDVKNESNFFASDLYYNVQLLRGKTLSEMEIVKKYQSVDFEISPYELKTVKFNYNLPKNIATGEYHIMVAMKSRTGLLVSFMIEDIGKITGSNYYLSFKEGNANFVKDGEEISPLTGPSYSKGESPEAYAIFTNEYSESIKVYPEMTVYARTYGFKNEPVTVAEGNAVEFNPGETKKVTMELPAQISPESYLAAVKMVDENGEVVSGVREFRYVVEGASAKILGLNAYYDKKLSQVNADVEAIGPADATVLSDAVVEVKAYNNDTNELITKENSTTNLDIGNKIVNLKLDLAEQTPPDIKIKADVKYNSEVLDTETTVIPGQYLTPEATQSLDSYPDVEGTTYEYAVAKLKDLGIIDGYSDNTFRPDRKITRAEFTKTVVEVLGLEVNVEDKLNSKFTDVTKEHWASGYINVAKRNNLVEGYSNETFKPDANITYAEVVTLLIRAIDKDNGVEDIGEWPNNYINKAKQVGITSQVVDINYSNKAIRGNVAKLLLETFENK